MEAFWVFGYGSLIWRPGFTYQEAQSAQLLGYHRALCIYSHHHRGTRQQPGLVMGLNPGGSCCGMAFYVPEAEAERAYSYLLRREKAEAAYHERRVALRLADGREVMALAFVSDTEHQLFAGDLPPRQLAEIVLKARGQTGTNTAYLANTVSALRRLNICEPKLEEILRCLAGGAEQTEQSEKIKP